MTTPSDLYAPLPVANAPVVADGEPASVARRIGARVLDAAFLYVPGGLVMAVGNVVFGVPEGASTDPRVAIAVGVWSVAFLVLYAAMLVQKGDSPGKRLMGIRVEHEGAPVSFVRGFLVRELAYYVLTLMLSGCLTLGMCVYAGAFLNLVFLLLPGNRPLHDRLCRTTVVRVQ